MKRTFRFRYAKEPDTGWTLTIAGDVEAETLEDAWIAVSDALGAGLWRTVSPGSSWEEHWMVTLVFPDGRAEPIYACEFCDGSGCSSCENRGFKYARGAAADVERGVTQP